MASGTTDFELPMTTMIDMPEVAFLGFRAVVFKTDDNTTVEPVISIGYNDPDYNNLASGVTLTSQATQYIELSPPHMAKDTLLKFNVTTPATANSFTASVYIFLLFIPI